jgi:hypothetical protein
MLLAVAVFGCSSSEKKDSAGSLTDGAVTTGGCGLHTGYKGDEQCIPPPPPSQGFQLHIGPSDYDNPEAQYVLDPSQEATTDYPAVSGNDQFVYFFYRQYRVRPTAHHMIITTPNDGDAAMTADSVSGIGIGGGRRIGTANRSEDYPTGGVIAPEDMHVGLPLNAHAPINVSYHTINVEDTPQLRELWVNFWYRDASEVTEPALEWFRIGDPLFTIAPLATATLGPYTCNVGAPGRLLWLYGHRHANNTRFTVTRTRGTQVDTIYDADKWEEPLLLEYSTSVTNTAPDIAHGVEGGWNGILDLAVGDVITWKCDVTNKNNATLRFTNNTFTGEMCIIDAEAVGATCSGL